MNIDEVTEWPDYIDQNGESFNLSFLNAKKVIYRHAAKDKDDVLYTLWVTYSLHCFAKNYDHLSDTERHELMYHSPKKVNGESIESRPFCLERYALAAENINAIVENLGSSEYVIKDGGHSSYLAVKLMTASGETVWYNVPFKVFKEKKKYRLHVLSAYPSEEPRGGGKVGFFAIAYNLRMNKKLPSNPHKGKRRT